MAHFSKTILLRLSLGVSNLISMTSGLALIIKKIEEETVSDWQRLHLIAQWS